ncbi:MAG: AraC family transcriptional regulator [Deltaproteobacteria bacterium]|nr:AraC family transcriptional regulator [Deltaproteobacteria bacterium]
MRAIQIETPKGTAPFFSWRKRKEAALSFVWHYHAEIELTYIIRSRGVRFVGDSTAPYASGDLVLVAPLVPHSWSGDPSFRGDHQCVVLQFHPRMIPNHDAGTTDQILPLSRLMADACRGVSFHGTVKQKAAALLRDLGARRPLDGLSRLYALLDLLSQAGGKDRRVLSTRAYGGPLTTQAGETNELSRVLAFVWTHHRHAISLQEAAASIGRSPSAFARFFRKSTGHSFVAYLNEFRIAQAASMLLEPNHSVAQVARSVGFANLAHFNRMFLRLRGQTPTVFRQRFAAFLAPRL